MINPDWVTLIKSRGFESDDLKTYMRFTVIASDVLVMISGAFALASRVPNFSKVNTVQFSFPFLFFCRQIY